MIHTDQFTIDMSHGSISAFIDKESGKDYCPPHKGGPILTIRSAGKDFAPSTMAWIKPDTCLQLTYDELGVTADIAVQAKASHIVLELVAISPQENIDLVMWGPYQTTIGETIGETIGVVRDDTFAIGIQALNIKTLGGYPDTDDDIMPSYDIFDSGNYKDITQEFKDKHLYRGNTAVATEYGSRIQAYCRNRSRDRIIENWEHERFLAPAYDDGGPVGSKIALFGCPSEEAMNTIGKIELAEGLPHPTINGQWAKTAYESTASYIIMDFGEGSIERAIEITKQAGLKWLYHSSPFATWGHFDLREDQFSNGWSGFRTCVDKARTEGIGIGFHTLSNFIKTNDAYVTPVPDTRLARVGSAMLTEDITATVETIPVASPDIFGKETTLNTVVIGQELVQYEGVSQSEPWKLLGCRRGSFGTTASVHEANIPVARLMDHDYKIFLTDAELSVEVAERIAEFCNFTGAMKVAFDGLEGNDSTGMGQYGSSLFTRAWYDKLKPELQGQVFNSASRPTHYNWHISTYMNWGEPWYAGFRESQTLYRLKNQYYYSRNLMHRMLGWFSLRSETSMEDAEWLLARAAGFDAGFSLATSVDCAGDQIVDTSKAVTDSGNQNNQQQILQTIHEWEEARMTGAFPEALKDDLQDVDKEFHLDKVSDGHWKLYPVYSYKDNVHSHETSCEIENPHEGQALQFIIRNSGELPVPGLTVDDVTILEGELEPGGIVKGDGQQAVLYDGNWKQLRCLQPDFTALKVAPGKQSIEIRWDSVQAGQQLNVELRTLGEAIALKTSVASDSKA